LLEQPALLFKLLQQLPHVAPIAQPSLFFNFVGGVGHAVDPEMAGEPLDTVCRSDQAIDVAFRNRRRDFVKQWLDVRQIDLDQFIEQGSIVSQAEENRRQVQFVMAAGLMGGWSSGWLRILHDLEFSLLFDRKTQQMVNAKAVVGSP
jgi:hypothetical protein